jgi:hypothetical protein
MAAPNTETSPNATTTGGNEMGIIVGSDSTDKIGFFGSSGTTRVLASSIADLAALKTYLTSLGLLG